MSEDTKSHTAFSRVIAALDVSCHDQQTLATAAEIAARLGLDLAALFIEDENLFRAAALPVARHVVAGSSAAASLDVEQLTTEMRALAALSESELRSTAARHGVKSSFRVVRGLPAAEVATETKTEDLLIVGAARAFADLPLSLNSPMREAIWRVGCSILQMRQPAPTRRPLLVLQAGSALTQRAVGAATRLASAASSRLEMILVGSPSDSARAAAKIEAALAEQGRDAGLRYTTSISAAQVIRAASEGANDMLILVSDLPELRNETELGEVMTAAPCAVLLVR